MYRRFFHHIPTRGKVSVHRHLLTTVKAGFHAHGQCTAREPVPIPGIKEVHRAAASAGYSAILNVSTRPCGGDCNACADGCQRHCDKTDGSKCVEVGLNAATIPNPTPGGRSGLAEAGRVIGRTCKTGDLVATETQCDDVRWMILQIVEDGSKLVNIRDMQQNPDLGSGIKFDLPKEGQPLAVRGLPLRPLRSGRGAGGDSTTQFFLAENDTSVLVPCHLLRVANKDIDMVRRAVRATRRSASTDGGPAMTEILTLKGNTKRDIQIACRDDGSD